MHTVTRWFKTAALCMLAAFCFAACEPKDPIEVIQTDYGYSVKVEDIHLAEGVFASLTVSMNDGPAEPVDVSMEYRIDDDPFLVIAKDGAAFQSGSTISLAKGMKATFTLPALKEGRHVVKLIFKNSFGKTINAEASFNVIRDPILVTEVVVPESMRLLRGETVEREVLLSPATADDLSLQMSVTDPKVASVTISGEGAKKTLKVEALSAGRTDVLLSHKDLPSASKVTVEVYDYTIAPLSDLTMTEGDEQTVTVSVTPQKEASLASSNAHVSVSPSGGNTFLLKAESAGTAVLTASVGDVAESFTVTVEKKPETISLSPRSATMAQGAEKTFSVYCSSEWSYTLSSDIVEVTERGTDYIILKNMNRALADASVTLTVVSDADPAVKASADIKVEGRTEDISLMVTSEDEGVTTLEVSGENDGWELATVPEGSKSAVSGSVITLRNDKYSDIRGFVVVRTKAQEVEASQEVTVRGLTAVLESVSLSETSFSIEEGQAFTLNATGRWSDGREEDITSYVSWEASSNLHVSGNRFTATEAGSAWVKASYEGKEARISGKVTAKPVYLSGLTVTPQTFSVEVGGTQSFTAEASYTNGTTKDVTAAATWSCEGGEAAAAMGTFSFPEVGSASVTVRYKEGDNEFSDSASGEVTPKPVTVISVAISSSGVDCTEGEDFKLSAYARMSDGSVVWNDGEWSVEDPSMVQVLGGGQFHAAAPGRTKITYAKGGKTATVPAYIREYIPEPDPEPYKLVITGKPSNILVGQGFQLKCTAKMTQGAEDKDVTSEVSWSSSLPSCADVSATGYVKAQSGGNCKITATLGTLSETINVAVYIPEPTLTNLSLSKTTLSVGIGETASITVNANYSDGSVKDVTSSCKWSTSSSSIATVSGGTVKGVRQGNATVTATYGGKSATCQVTVTGQECYNITFTIEHPTTGKKVDLPVGSPAQLEKGVNYIVRGTVYCKNPTNTYPLNVAEGTSSNPTVATLTGYSGGVYRLKAVSTGTSVISFSNKASSSDPGFTRSVTVQVK